MTAMRFLRPGHADLVASGLPPMVAWTLLRTSRAMRLTNYLRRRRVCHLPSAIIRSATPINTPIHGGATANQKPETVSTVSHPSH